MGLVGRIGRRRTALIAAAVVAAMVAGGVGVRAALRPTDPVVVVEYTGDRLSTPPTEPATIPQPTTTQPPPPPPDPAAIPSPGPAVGLKVADGHPFPPAIEFRSTIPVPDHLVFVLVIGSDARPREDLLRSRADSIHLLAVNPHSGQGTIVGFPRDSYVQFPNGRRGKINDALVRGGPVFLVETVRRMTGLPIDYYVLTGFVGLQRMVDELGGVDVFVERRMNDRLSGARFQAGWHHFNGGQALAYSRNRHDVPDGDFGRSMHHGTLMLSALAKMRSEVGDDAGLLRWLDVLRRNVAIDVPLDHLPRLAALARRIDPGRIKNVVLPGRVGYAGSASVVYLTQDAPRLFVDLRDDAVIGAPDPPTTTTSTTTTTASTTTVPPTTTSTTVASTTTESLSLPNAQE